MAQRPSLRAAAPFHVLYPAGLLVFALSPTVDEPRCARSRALGALFGLCAYGTYDLSKLATLRDWPVHLTVIDMA